MGSGIRMSKDWKQEVKETVQYIMDNNLTYVVDDPALDYMVVTHSNGDEYILQNDDYNKFYDEYMNSGLEELLWFDEYIMYVSQDW